MKKHDKLMKLRGTDNQEAIAFEATLAEQPFVLQSELKVCLDILKSEQKWNQGQAGRAGSMKILAGTANVPLAEEISGRIGMGLTPVTCKKFADGEIFIQVARMIEAMGVDRVICVDLHCGQIQGFFGPRTPADNLYAGPIALQYFKFKNLNKLVVVSPDAGGVARAKMFRDGLADIGVEVQMAMIIKQRKEAGVVASMDLVGSVDGCDCIIVDDMIDTAGTLTKAADEIKAFGAARVFAFATHGLFNGPALERIEKCALEEVICSNTVPLKPGTHDVTNKIKQLSVGKLLAETIQRVHTGTSVSDLFSKPGALFASAPVKASNQHTGKASDSQPEPEPAP